MKILMHMCCAPCSEYPLLYFKNNNIDVTGYFYNPNIHPIDEYNRRYESVILLSNINKIKVVFNDEFKQEEWAKYNDSDIERCRMCYGIRLEKTAIYAKEAGFDAFTTSLLVSPYQNHSLIRALCDEYANKYNIPFYYQDFRPFFREGQELAKKDNLYRQKYCGCIISLNNKK